jgi:integrase
MIDLIEQYLRTYKGRLKPSTFLDYRSILRHHLSHFEDLEALNMGLEEYLSSLEISGKRRNNILSTARSYVAWARRRNLWGGNLLEIPRFKSRSKKIKPLSPEETRLIMTYAPHPYRDYFHFALLTGVRTGEALGLRFEDFDLAAGIISIRRAITCGEIVTTKTAAGERELPLLRPLRELFNRRATSNETGSPWFFYSIRAGHIISRKALARSWKGLLQAFNIGPRPLYATRHTFASLAIAAGEDPLWVAKAMGHSRPDQLFLKYSSFLEGVKRDGEKVSSMVMGGKQSFLRVLP